MRKFFSVFFLSFFLVISGCRESLIVAGLLPLLIPSGEYTSKGNYNPLREEPFKYYLGTTQMKSHTNVLRYPEKYPALLEAIEKQLAAKPMPYYLVYNDGSDREYKLSLERSCLDGKQAQKCQDMDIILRELDESVETLPVASGSPEGVRRVAFPIRPDFCVEMSLPPEGITLKELRRLGLFLYPYCQDIDPSAEPWKGLIR